MMFFATVFASAFNLTNSRENDNKSNKSIEKVLDAEQFSENMDVDETYLYTHQILDLEDELYSSLDVDMPWFNNQQSINQDENSEDVVSSNPNIDEIYLDSHRILDQILDIEDEVHSTMDVDLDFFDNQQNINQNENFKDLVCLNMNSIINEEKQVSYNENNLENINGDTVPQNTYNNINNKNSDNIENRYDEKDLVINARKVLTNTYLFDLLDQYEQFVSSNNVNGESDSLRGSNENVIQKHSSNNNKNPSTDNILFTKQQENCSTTSHNITSKSFKTNLKCENDTPEDTYVTYVTRLDDQKKSISDENSQLNYSIHYIKASLIDDIILENRQIKIMPDLTLYKGLKNLSIKYNFISSVPKSISKLKLLKKLDLSHNRIDDIACAMESMELEWLDLSYNYLTYSICKPIFTMTTLKYLNLQNNEIDFIIKFNSKGLESLNISNNPIRSISKYFYNLSNIIRLSMSNLKVSSYTYCNKVLPNLRMFDISHNRIHHHIDNIKIFSTLEEVNLSNCELKDFLMSSKMLNFKKIILFKNNIQVLPIEFIRLRDNLEILDLRENPLEIFTTKTYIGALGMLEHFYRKIKLDESIMKTIQELSFHEISSKTSKKKIIYFKKPRKNKVNNEFNNYIKLKILEKKNEKIKVGVEKVITLIEEIRDSGFIDFGGIMKKAMKIIKGYGSKNIRIQHVLNYLNNKFSSKLYKLIEDILSKYKVKSLKSALIYIYNSDEHLNYWMYHLRYILSFTGIESVEENPQIHNDKNIILNCFINSADLDELIGIIKLELEKDKEMIKVLYNLIYNIQDRSDKLPISIKLKRIETVNEYSIKYILKMYQIINVSDDY